MGKEKTPAEKLKEVEALPRSMQRAGLERVIGNEDEIRKFVSEHQVCQLGDYGHVIYKGKEKPYIEPGSIPVYAALDLLGGAIPCEYHMNQFRERNAARTKAQEITEESKPQESAGKAAAKELSEKIYGLSFKLKTGGNFEYITNILRMTKLPYQLVSINAELGLIGLQVTEEYEKGIVSLTLKESPLDEASEEENPLDEASRTVKGLDELIEILRGSKQIKEVKDLTEEHSRGLYEKAKVYTPNR